MANENSATFIDLDIQIFQTGTDSYVVRAQTSGSDLVSGELDWAGLNEAEFIAKLEQLRDEPFTTDQTLFRDVGDTLFAALFHGHVRDLFSSVYVQQVQSQADTYLRLRLDVDEAAVEVAELPWEFLSWDDGFLATQIKTLVTRQLLNLDYGDLKSLTVVDKPRVLIVIPQGSGLETREEEATITTVLTKAGIPYDTLKERVTIVDVADKLATGEYSILHFIGHGDFGEGSDGLPHGSLRFNSSLNDVVEEEDEEWVEDTQLQALFSSFNALKLVVLNACQGAQVDENSTGRGFIGTAPAILKAGIPAVVAMQYAIRDDVAIQFADTLYKRLTVGRWAGQIDTAITLARNACYLTYPNDRGFATPILYLRSENGTIFTIDEQCVRPPKPDDYLIDEYRHYDAATLAELVNAAEEELVLVQNYMRDHPDASAGMATEAEEKEILLARKIDQLRAMYEWKFHLLCERQSQLQSVLDSSRIQLANFVADNGQTRQNLHSEILQTERALEAIEIQIELAEIR